ncbi:MAG: OsmC family protein [Candidatus Marinimicrobia bacterium]|nr:OsmC family protein [Candidatus Neomarinimicrobiota bacterium]
MANTVNVRLQSMNKDLTFAAKSNSGHWTMIDSSEKAGGNEAGPTPSNYFLRHWADVREWIRFPSSKKKRTPFSRLDIFIEGKKREEHPKSFTDINLRFVLHSNGGDKALRDLKRAAELSYEKYCTVSNMLKSSATITYDMEIVDEE